MQQKKWQKKIKSQYDAVYYKGKGLYKLLDGDQICVYEPSKIFIIDKSLSATGEIGSKVIRKIDGMKGTILSRESVEGILERFPGASTWLKPESKYKLKVKWNKGGIDYNVQDIDINYI